MSHRREQKEALRQQRLEEQQRAGEAARRKRLVGYGAAGVLVVAAIVALAVVALAGGGDDGGGGGGDGGSGATVSYPDDPPAIPQAREFDLKKAAQAAGCKLQNPRNEGATHVTSPVKYKANPPTSGNHHPNPAQDGAYESNPGTEHLVHALEHGRIEIQFRPNAPQRVIDQLKALYDEDTYHTILLPNGTKMPFLVAATAWDHSLGCTQMNDRVFDAIRSFKDTYRDKGPEFVP
jgi:hypothetical protein